MITFRYSQINIYRVVTVQVPAVKCDDDRPSLPLIRKPFCWQNTAMGSSHRTCRNVFRWRSSCAITAVVVGALSFAATADTTTVRASGPRNTLGVFDHVDNAVAAAVDAAVDAVDGISPKLSQVRAFGRSGGRACVLRVCACVCVCVR